MCIVSEQMNIVIVGHVDHGKSTIIGRLLVDTKSLPEGKLEQVRANCEKNAKPFEYAFLLDALKDEQAQGITIDSARIFFKTKKRYYIIIDAPGHIEFLKNMISGAARAEAALLVIDAHEGIQENTRRHGYMLSLLGIDQVVVLINKMDLVDYSESVYLKIIEEYKSFLAKFSLHVSHFIPVSGMMGDNIVTPSEKMPWYQGQIVLDTIDQFKKKPLPIDSPLRMMVQDVYKFTAGGDNRRIVAGTIDTGVLKKDDEIIFYPQGKKGRIKTIESFSTPTKEEAKAGEAVGFTLYEQVYIKRGSLITRTIDPKPKCTSRILVSLFWLGQQPLTKNKSYYLKYGTCRAEFEVESIERVMNASNLESTESPEHVEHHSVAECVLKIKETLAFDEAKDSMVTSRFVIVDNYEISGGGIIREAMEDSYTWVRDKVILRNYKWEKSMISSVQRAEKYNQKSTLILITGDKNVGKKELAKELETNLFQDGKFVYFLGIGNILYGVDADIKSLTNQQQEHFRRLAEITNMFLDAGAILIITAVQVSKEELEIIKLSVNPDKILTVWVGSSNDNNKLSFDIQVSGKDFIKESIQEIKNLLQQKNIIFRP